MTGTTISRFDFGRPALAVAGVSDSAWAAQPEDAIYHRQSERCLVQYDVIRPDAARDAANTRRTVSLETLHMREERGN